MAITVCQDHAIAQSQRVSRAVLTWIYVLPYEWRTYRFAFRHSHGIDRIRYPKRFNRFSASQRE